MTLKPGDVVTVKHDDGNTEASNTYIIDGLLPNNDVLLMHPLSGPNVLIRVTPDKINIVAANIKDSSERALDFARKQTKYLDYNKAAEIEALALYYVVNRKLTSRQKNGLSAINGYIASIQFNQDIKQTISFVHKNKGLLDEFNFMWYSNFKNLFNGTQAITSLKQRQSIFNIAGFILSELENPTAQTK